MRFVPRLYAVSILPTLFLCASSADASILAGKFTNPAHGHDYYLLNSTSWSASEAEAVSMGGHLATIRNSGENTFIYNTFAPLIPSATLHRFLWIGLEEYDDESGWYWSSGEPYSFSNWDPTQPDENSGVDEDFVGVALPPLPVGLWHDVTGNNTSVDTGWGVVEVVPEPGGWALGTVVALAAFAGSRRRAVFP